jgi:hypothetical protein
MPDQKDVQIDWSVFTNEERDAIHLALKAGRYEDLGAAIVIVDGIREAQIQKIKSKYAPSIQVAVDSKVQEELAKAEASSGGVPVIATPEDEAKWQAKIDAEKSAQEALVAANQSPQLAVAPTPVEAPVAAPVEAPVVPEAPVVEPVADLKEGEVVKEAIQVDVSPEVAAAIGTLTPEAGTEVVSQPDVAPEAPVEAAPEAIDAPLGVGKPCCGSKGPRHLKTCPEANKA